MISFETHSAFQTEKLGESLSPLVHSGDVVAMFGGLGVGKTAFTRGFVRGRGINSAVQSPTFSLVNEYKGSPSVYHFDMYRVNSWGDLYSTGFFDYIDMGGILLVEWSENIENALPQNAIRVEFKKGDGDFDRIISISGDIDYDNLSC